MDDEIVDVVDDNNQVLQQAPLSQVHQQGLLHRTFLGLIKDAEGRWVLAKESKGRQDAGKYVSPIGGHVKAGETEEHALKREVLEDLGLQQFSYQAAGKIVYNQFINGVVERHHFMLFEIVLEDSTQLEHKKLDYRALTEQELAAEVRTHPQEFGTSIFIVLNNFYPYLLQQV